jgi:U32 family peptidase
MKIPELLAPAGSRESLAAAIHAGADAVYLGGPSFGARGYAKNFDRPGLLEAISYAHLRNVRVYVTVNTLVLDSELNAAAEFLFYLYESGADGILVQDHGVASVAREISPDLPLHASTQMTVYNREGVRFAREMGFSRVVLARELSLPEIRDIGQSPECKGIGLEMFVHGALCYSYSGQCLLSSFIGGRSGNRGTCAQPCRKPYTFVRGQADAYGRPVSLSRVVSDSRYLLSTKDLSLYPLLDRIVDLPVESLKIEGRMRSPRYVRTVVSIYRKALDAIGAGTWIPTPVDEKELALAFNRGFTRGYAGGSRHQEVMGRDRPDHRGLLVGTVSSYDQGRHQVLVALQGSSVPERGDGVVFNDPGSGRELGMIIQDPVAVTNAGVLITVREKVSPGTLLYITRQSGQAEEAAREPAENNREEPWIPVSISVVWDDQKRPVISGRTAGKQGTRISCGCTGVPMTAAQTRPLTDDTIRAQIAKTGGTPFRIQELEIKYPGGLFSPVGELNGLRRALFSGLTEAILASWKPSQENRKSAEIRLSWFNSTGRGIPETIPSDEFRPMSIAVYASGYTEACAALEAGCDVVYFEPASPDRVTGDRCRNREQGEFSYAEAGPGIIPEVIRLCSRFPEKIVWKWPSITDTGFVEDTISRLMGTIPDGLSGIMTESPGIADRIRRDLPGITLYGGQGLNIFNHRSVASLLPLFRRFTLSPELSRTDIGMLVARYSSHSAPPEFEVIVQGTADALVSRDCLNAGIPNGGSGCPARDVTGFQGIQDSTGRIFPVWTDWSCRTHIGNSSETCLVDELPWLGKSGITSVAIDARHKTPAYAADMVRLYGEAMLISQTGRRKQDFSGVLSRIRKISQGGITAAHFRGSLCTPGPEE